MAINVLQVNRLRCEGKILKYEEISHLKVGISPQRPASKKASRTIFCMSLHHKWLQHDWTMKVGIGKEYFLRISRISLSPISERGPISTQPRR